jgi:hypothetical protein
MLVPTHLDIYISNTTGEGEHDVWACGLKKGEIDWDHGSRTIPHVASLATWAERPTRVPTRRRLRQEASPRSSSSPTF